MVKAIGYRSGGGFVSRRVGVKGNPSRHGGGGKLMDKLVNGADGAGHGPAGAARGLGTFDIKGGGTAVVGGCLGLAGGGIAGAAPGDGAVSHATVRYGNGRVGSGN